MLLRAFQLATLLGAAVLLSGCGKPAAPALAKQTTAAAEGWNWDSFPNASRMRLATVACQLQPRSMLSIPSPVAGALRVYVDQPQITLEKDHVWAEFEPAIFAQESKSIEEARIKIEEREKLQRELDLPRQRMQISQQIEDAEKQLTLMRLMATNQDLARYTLGSNPAVGNALRPEAMERAEMTLELLRTTQRYVQETNLAFMGVDLRSMRSDWEARKLEFDRRQSQARIKMPFAGQLTLSIPITEGVQEYLVNVGQELAVARDLSAIRVRVPLSNAAWTGIPGDRMEAIVRLPNGEALPASFAFQKLEKIQTREEAVYYFMFPAERSAAAARLLGTEVSCEVWAKLPENARIVPKLRLSLENSAAFQGLTWAQGVAKLWPGARVLAEGQNELAIAPPVRTAVKAP